MVLASQKNSLTDDLNSCRAALKNVTKPNPEPEKPKPEKPKPEKPEPEKPEPEKPKPEPEKPKPEPEKPKPDEENPKPDAEKPETGKPETPGSESIEKVRLAKNTDSFLGLKDLDVKFL